MDYHYLSSSGKCVFRGFGVSNLTARPRVRGDFISRGDTMPDRSSGQDLPEERGRGSHARGSQPQHGAADAYRTEPVNSHRGRNGDGYGPGTPEAYRPVNGSPFGA